MNLGKLLDRIDGPALYLLAIVLTLTGLTVSIIVDIDGDGPAPAKTITLHAPATTQELPPVATPAPAGDLQGKPSDLRDSTPDGVPERELAAAKDQAAAAARTMNLPAANQPLPSGGAQLNSCKTSYQTNRASYGGRKAHSFGTALHYTVGANIPGWADVLGARSYLNNVGLSASDIMDFEGHCLHTVPYAFNPYTQGFFNQFYDSIEIIATGKESRAQWLAAPIFKDKILAKYLYSRLKARGVPIRFVDPVGCTPLAGYTDHDHLECGNDHIDVSPAFPFDVLARQLRELGANPARAIQLRQRHRVTHAELRRRHCAPLARTRSARCRLLWHRNAAVHAAAKRERIRL